MDEALPVSSKESLAMLNAVSDALAQLPKQTLFQVSVRKRIPSGEQSLSITHHPQIDAGVPLQGWPTNVSSPIDGSPSWKREGGACEFPNWNGYWPMSLTQFMVPWVLEGIARHHLNRVSDILAGHLVGGTPLESVKIQFQLWATIATNIAVIARDRADNGSAEVARQQLQLHVATFHEWEKSGLEARLDGAARRNFTSMKKWLLV